MGRGHLEVVFIREICWNFVMKDIITPILLFYLYLF